MRVDSNSDRAPFSLTEQVISQMNACSAQGKSLNAAAVEIGVDRKTIKKAAAKQGLSEWLDEKFPHKKEFGGGGHNKEKAGEIRWLTPEQIGVPLEVDWNSRFVRSAAMVWGKTA